MQKRFIKTSDDGSHTIYNENIDECYHSSFGAWTESSYIFIEKGYKYSKSNPVKILEIGFGTGLNALLTLIEAENQKRETIYHAIELYPVEEELVKSLNYVEKTSNPFKELFYKMHEDSWGQAYRYSPYFELQKIEANFINFELNNIYDVVYFDAFSPEKQPELWTLEIFEKLYKNMNSGSVFVTYCAKGIVKSALRNVGFKVERLPGPPGKRHILRAIK